MHSMFHGLNGNRDSLHLFQVLLMRIPENILCPRCHNVCGESRYRYLFLTLEMVSVFSSI
jgi:hypothetical protein